MTDDINPTTCCGMQIDRRQLLQSLVVVAGTAVASRASMAATPAEMPPQVGDFLVTPLGKNPLGPDNVRLNAASFEAWPMSPDGTPRRGSNENAMQLYRFNLTEIPAELRDKCPEGVVALTQICTHSGCPANEYDSKTGIITCPCHGSQFFPKEGGKLAHGPAVRKLPMLPLAVKDGKLVVAGNFDGKVGGDFPMGDDH